MMLSRYMAAAALTASSLLLLPAASPPAAPPAGPGEVPASQEDRDTLPDPDVIPAEPEPLTEDRLQADEEIRRDLQALFDRIDVLRGVEVEVEAGVVRLTGTVLSGEARQQAEELARESPGVLFVENRIREATSLRERVSPLLEGARGQIVEFLAWLPLLMVGLVIVIVFSVLGSFVGRWEGPHIRMLTPNPFLRTLIRQGLKVGLVLLGVLLALELLDATALVGAVIGVAGIFGLAVGFAFRDVVENYLAGVILSLRQPFAPNDHVEVEGQEGKVIRLTARETILMTLSGNHVRIPNAAVFRSVILNYTRNPRRRFDFEVSVGADEDLLRAQEVARRTLEEMEGVLDDPGPAARVSSLGDSWVTLRVTAWVDQTATDFVRVRSRGIRLVKEALDDSGVSMPSPEYRVALEQSPARDAEPPRGPARPAGKKAPGPVPSETAPSRVEVDDISVDTSLDEQIEEDRRASEEEDLLRPPTEPDSRQ